MIDQLFDAMDVSSDGFLDLNSLGFALDQLCNPAVNDVRAAISS